NEEGADAPPRIRRRIAGVQLQNALRQGAPLGKIVIVYDEFGQRDEAVAVLGLQFGEMLETAPLLQLVAEPGLRGNDGFQRGNIVRVALQLFLRVFDGGVQVADVEEGGGKQGVDAGRIRLNAVEMDERFDSAPPHFGIEIRLA